MYEVLDLLEIQKVLQGENADNPTLLYESKGKRAMNERNILSEILEEYENGESANGKPKNVNPVLSSDWLRQRHGVRNNSDIVGRRSSDRDVRVLQRQSSSEPSSAFKNVVKNLFEIQGEDRHNSGLVGRGRVKNNSK